MTCMVNWNLIKRWTVDMMRTYLGAFGKAINGKVNLQEEVRARTPPCCTRLVYTVYDQMK
jgi:hypothetical protein